METNEIMNNEEVTEAAVETTENVINKSSGKLKAAAIGGLTILIGGLTVKFIVLPAIAKRKAKKRQGSDKFIEGEYTELSSDSNDSDEDIEKEEK